MGYEVQALFVDLRKWAGPLVRYRLDGSAYEVRTFAMNAIKLYTPVLSGTTYDSVAATKVTRIGPQRTGFQFTVFVGDENTVNTRGDQYPPYVEYGTKVMEPRRFVEAALPEISMFMHNSLTSHLNLLQDDIEHTPVVIIKGGNLNGDSIF